MCIRKCNKNTESLKLVLMKFSQGHVLYWGQPICEKNDGLSEPIITVGHRTFSNHFAQLSDQILCCSTILSEQHNVKNNGINFN